MLSQTVYLAGGMKTEWRDKVAASCEGLTFFNPVDKETEQTMSVERYAPWDLHFVKKADILFGFMERTNPSGIGLACEMGFAFGIGKTVILVLEEGNEFMSDTALSFLRQVAHVRFSNLDEGIAYLKTFERA